MKINKYRLVDCMWGAFIMSLVLSYAMPIIAKGFITFDEFITSVVVSFFVGLFIKLFLPIDKISSRFAAKCGTEKGTMKFRLCSSISTTLIMGTIMSIIMTWWGMHAAPDYQIHLFSEWISTYPWVLIIVFVMVNVCHLSGSYIVKSIYGNMTQEVVEQHETQDV